MRIAIFHNLPSGGGKRALCEMVKRLSLRHEIDVFTLDCSEHDFCDLRPYCDNHVVFPFRSVPLAHRPFGRINQGIRAINLMRLRLLQRQIANHINAQGYDVVFVHNCQFGQSPSLLSFLQGPSIYYCQEPPRYLVEPPVSRPYELFSPIQKMGNLVDPFPALYRTTLSRLDRENVKAADLVLVNSAYSRETLYKIYNIFARVMYLGVDSKLFHLQLSEKENFVLSVGALNARKGFDFLIRSLALINEEERPPLIIVCNMVDPREKEFLTLLAEQLQVAISFRIKISESELVNLYNKAHLTLYAPIMEPFGFVPLESMACGTPVVGVREGGVRETIVHEKTGLLMERDVSEFAMAVMELLRNEQWRCQLGQQARQHVEMTWQWDRSVSAIEHQFCSLVKQWQPVALATFPA